MFDWMTELLDFLDIFIQGCLKMIIEVIFFLGVGVIFLVGLLICVKLVLLVLRENGVKEVFGMKLKEK